MENRGVIIVTGATSGIGKQLAMQLSIEGHSIVMACRNIEKAEVVKKDILLINPASQVDIMELDLSSLASVRQFTGEIIERYDNIYALVNNAGAMNLKYSVTEDNLEATVAVNYFGTSLLTTLLEPHVKKGGVIILTGSVTYKYGRIDKYFRRGGAKYRRMPAYFNSKLAITLYAKKLAKKCNDKCVCIIDPGVVDTAIITRGDKFRDFMANIFFRPLIKSPKKAILLHKHILFNADNMKYHGTIFSQKILNSSK